MASQQPPPRPWFRLATMAARSAPTPQPDPVPQPRPITIRPAFRATPQPTQTEDSTPPQASIPAPPPPVTTTQMPQAFVPPASRSPPSAPAPATPAFVTPVSRSPPTTPAPAPEPSPPITQPAATTTRSTPTLFQASAAPKASPTPAVFPVSSSSSIPQSPKLKVASPSLPTVNYPAPKTVSQVQTSAPKPSAYGADSVSSPATISTSFPKPRNSQSNTTSPSPNNRHIVHPPSPLTLPPAQLKSDNERELKFPQEFEQKAVLVQETKEKPRVYSSERPNNGNPHKGDRGANKKPNHKDKGKHKNTSNPDGSGMRILTVAGDNKGAIMELRPTGKKHDFGNNPGNFRTWGEGEKTGSGSSSSSEEGKSKKNGKHESAMTNALSLPYVNSNVQGVNNSILFNATCTHHDPGVHISLFRTAGSGRGFKVKKHMNIDD